MSELRKSLKFSYSTPEKNENHEILKISLQNIENHENSIILSLNHENHKFLEFHNRTTKNNDNLIIPCQNHENHEIRIIPFENLKFNYSTTESRKS